MSILSELKKLTGKNNATVVSEALPDSFSSGGGAKVLTLYANSQGGTIFAFKDEDCTEGYNYAEAETALKEADVIKVYMYDSYLGLNCQFFPYKVTLRYGSEDDYNATVYCINYTGSFASTPVHLAYMRTY
jgi:hypothetical protein